MVIKSKIAAQIFRFYNTIIIYVINLKFVQRNRIHFESFMFKGSEFDYFRLIVFEREHYFLNAYTHFQVMNRMVDCALDQCYYFQHTNSLN